MKPCIALDTIEGLDKSQKAIVLLTEGYLQCTPDFDTNSARKFDTLTKKVHENVVLVLLDSNIADPKSWLKTPVEYYLGHKKYINFTTEENMLVNLDILVEEALQETQIPAS